MRNLTSILAAAATLTASTVASAAAFGGLTA
ncbi:MAG: hypothetical protein RIR10_198, partial [Planctomycetota bacterium]